MKFENGRVSDIQIAYIGGGSRGWAWILMTDLAREEALSGTVRLYDIDGEAAKANALIGNRLKAREDAVGKWDYVVKDTLKEALTGADFVIISVLPKTFDEMETDVHMPERLGIYQSVGDTAGPGGIIRAMRTIPMFLEFAEGIKQYCPKAWVINYTNPMALCVKALYHAFPEIKAFGCCHEVFGTQDMLVNMVKEELGDETAGRKDIQVNVLGINHFTWFDRASYKGIDLFPVYSAYVNKFFGEGVSQKEKVWANTAFGTKHRVKMDLFNHYGLIAAAGDRHLAEFMPGDIYLKNPETVASWNFGLTSVAWRKDDLKERMVRSAKLVSGEEQLELKPSGEEGVDQIKALCGLGRLVTNVNVPNTGRQISNLPESAVVETNAVFEKDAIRPVQAGAVPENVRELLMPHVENQERVMQAALTVDHALVAEAFLADPQVKGRISKEEVRALVEDMLAATL